MTSNKIGSRNSLNLWPPRRNDELKTKRRQSLTPLQVKALRSFQQLRPQNGGQGGHLANSGLSWEQFSESVGVRFHEEEWTRFTHICSLAHLSAEEMQAPEKWYRKHEDLIGKKMVDLACFLFKLPCVVTTCDTMISLQESLFSDNQRRMDPDFAKFANSYSGVHAAIILTSFLPRSAKVGCERTSIFIPECIFFNFVSGFLGCNTAKFVHFSLIRNNNSVDCGKSRQKCCCNFRTNRWLIALAP